MDPFISSIEIHKNGILLLKQSTILKGDYLAGFLIGLRIYLENLPDKFLINIEPKFDVENFISTYYLPGKNIKPYAWFLGNNLTQAYEWYQFSDVEFVNGYISLFSTFELDFRNYIKGPPFRINIKSQTLEPLDIEGYDIVPFDNEDLVHLFPFYTGTIEIGQRDYI